MHKAEDEIFADYLHEKFNETDLEENASLRNTIEFNEYYANVRFSELVREFKKSVMKVMNFIRKFGI